MGFKDANWAYSLNLPMAQKAVLAAICQRTDDKTHITLVGQQTIAEMVGSSVDTVRRAVGILESLGVVSRTKRHRANGARNSDSITVNTTYTAESQQGTEPTRQTANKADSSNLPDSVQQPTRLSAGGNSVNQLSQPEGQPVIPKPDLEALFDEAWTHWPKKVDRKNALAKFKTVAKKRDPHQLVKDITAHGQAHAAYTTRQFIPGLTVWLNKERWNNPLPQPDANTTISRGDRNLAFIQSLGNTETSRREISV